MTGGDSDLGETTVTPSMVLAFDFSGGYLAAGSGTLATLSFDESVDGIDLTLSGIILSSTEGSTLVSNDTADASVVACTNDDADTLCDAIDDLSLIHI